MQLRLGSVVQLLKLKQRGTRRMLFKMSEKEGPEKEDPILRRERRSVVILGFIFLCVFTSYLSIQNLQSSINEESGLGVISLACVYVTSIVSCVFAPLTIKSFSAKWVIVICCSTHLLYAVSNFYPKFYTLIPTSILLGSITGPFWTTNGMYITTCALKYADRSNKSSSLVLGKFFSIFYFIYVWSQIIGNLLSSALLSIGSNLSVNKDGNRTAFTSNFTVSDNNTFSTCCHHCAINHCPDTIDSSTPAPVQPDKTPLYYLLGVFVLCVLIGVIISIFLLPAIPKDKENQNRRSAISSLVSCGTLLKDPIMLLMIPSSIAFSWAEAFKWSDITQAYISCSYGVALVGYLMAANALCLGVSAFAMSRIAKIVGRQRLLVTIYIAFMLLVVCYYLLPEQRPLYVTVVVVCVHGIIEGPMSTQLKATVGLLLGGSKEAAFANLEAWKGLGYSIFFGISYIVCVKVRVFILLALYACALPSLIAAEVLYNKRHITQTEKEVTEALDVTKNNQEDGKLELHR